MNILNKIAQERANSLELEENQPEFPPLPRDRPSLSNSVREIARSRNSRRAIIAEIKPASPSLGVLQERVDLPRLLKSYDDSGACGVSVLTEPGHFGGSLQNLHQACRDYTGSVLMKDFLVHPYQIEAARMCGASNILVILAICDLDKMMPLIDQYQLEPLFEVHDESDLDRLDQIRESYPLALVGVNNRDLRDLSIDFNISRTLIPKIRDLVGEDVVVISESGVQTREDVDLLYSYGADGFLVGSVLMKGDNVEEILKGLIDA